MLKKLLVILAIVIIGTLIYFFLIDTEPTNYQMIIADNFETEEGGLYQDNALTGYDETYEFASQYYFKGDELTNYFWHDDFCFNIVNITFNNHLKVVLNGYSETQDCTNVQKINENIAFADEKNNDWLASNILETFELWQDENKMFDKAFNYDDDIFVTGDWYIGQVDSRERVDGITPITITDNIEQERKGEVFQSKIGLLTQSEYLKTLEGLQATYARNNVARSTYLFDETNFWTLTGELYDNERVYAVTSADVFDEYKESSKSILRLVYADDDEHTVFPALFVDGELDFTGSGTRKDPYRVK